MTKKKILTVLLIAVAAGAWPVYQYIKQAQEPKAGYVDTRDAGLSQIRKDLDEYKAHLKKEGLYDCCIRNDCSWCAIYMGHCPCGKMVSNKGAEKSCPECAAAWNKKRGKIPGVDADAIEVTTFGVYGFEESGHYHQDKGPSRHNAASEGQDAGHVLSGRIEAGVRVVELKAFRYGFSPDPVVVKKGERVRFMATSTDTTHGMAIADFGVNVKLPENKTQRVEFVADKAGMFNIFCSVYCGPGHGNMSGRLIVLDEDGRD